jgi:hypothetical protein
MRNFGRGRTSRSGVSGRAEAIEDGRRMALQVHDTRGNAVAVALDKVTPQNWPGPHDLPGKPTFERADTEAALGESEKVVDRAAARRCCELTL